MTKQEILKEMVDFKRRSIEAIKEGMKELGESSYYFTQIERLNYEIEFIERELLDSKKSEIKITDEKAYIKFMDKSKNYQITEKVFFGSDIKEATENAKVWGKENIQGFNEDMINYK